MTDDEEELLNRRFLLEIGPLPEGILAALEKHEALYSWQRSNSGGVDPNLYVEDPYRRGTWAHLEFEPMKANPFDADTPEFAAWKRGWSDVNFATGAWEYPKTSSFVLQNQIQQILEQGFRTPRTAGMKALLSGEARASNPLTKEPEREAWDEGWLKGCWIKGHLAALLGEPIQTGELILQFVERASAAQSSGESAEMLAWRDGWKQVGRRRVFDEARRMALSGKAETDSPKVEPEFWNDWQEGWRAGEGEAAKLAIRKAGERAFELGASQGANPHAAGSVWASAWLEGWSEASRLAGTLEMFRPIPDESEATSDEPPSVLLEEIQAASSAGTDAYLRGDALDSNPFEPDTAQWRVWKRSWRMTEDLETGVYEDPDEIPDDYDEEDREGNSQRAAKEREDEARLFSEWDGATIDAIAEQVERDWELHGDERYAEDLALEAAIKAEIEVDRDHAAALIEDDDREESRRNGRGR